MAEIHLHNGSTLEVNNDGFIEFFSKAIKKEYTWMRVTTKDGSRVLLRIRMVDYILEK